MVDHHTSAGSVVRFSFCVLALASCFVSTSAKQETCAEKICWDFNSIEAECEQKMPWEEASKMCQTEGYELCEEEQIFALDSEIRYHQVWTKTKCDHVTGEHAIVSHRPGDKKTTSYCQGGGDIVTKAKVFCCDCKVVEDVEPAESRSVFHKAHSFMERVFGTDHEVRNILIGLIATAILIILLCFFFLSYKTVKKMKKMCINLRNRCQGGRGRIYSEESTSGEEASTSLSRSKKEKAAGRKAKKAKRSSSMSALKRSQSSSQKKPKDARKKLGSRRDKKKSRKFKATEEEQQIMIQIDSDYE